MIGMYKYIFLLFLLFIGSQNAAVSSLCGLLLGQKPCSIGTKTLLITLSFGIGTKTLLLGHRKNSCSNSGFSMIYLF